MEAFRKRRIKDGKEYDKYFEPANNINDTIKLNGYLNDTIELMQKAINDSVRQTHKIAFVLKGSNLVETCKNIWLFVYTHIQYSRDEKGKEQVRTAYRTWQDRHKGVDCDCYTVFICSILQNLGIESRMRIAAYNKNVGFQHVYPIVPCSKNIDAKGYIVIDCVLDEFNKEHPFLEKKDYKIKVNDMENFENFGFIEENRKGYDYVPDSEIGVLPVAALLTSAKASAFVGGKASAIIGNANGILSKVGGSVQQVAGTVKNVLGIGKNKEAADEAERQLAAAKGLLNSLKQTLPNEIAQLQQKQKRAKADYDAEIAQLRQTLNSI